MPTRSRRGRGGSACPTWRHPSAADGYPTRGLVALGAGSGAGPAAIALVIGPCHGDRVETHEVTRLCRGSMAADTTLSILGSGPNRQPPRPEFQVVVFWNVTEPPRTNDSDPHSSPLGFARCPLRPTATQ